MLGRSGHYLGCEIAAACGVGTEWPDFPEEAIINCIGTFRRCSRLTPGDARDAHVGGWIVNRRLESRRPTDSGGQQEKRETQDAAQKPPASSPASPEVLRRDINSGETNFPSDHTPLVDLATRRERMRTGQPGTCRRLMKMSESSADGREIRRVHPLGTTPAGI